MYDLKTSFSKVAFVLLLIAFACKNNTKTNDDACCDSMATENPAGEKESANLLTGTWANAGTGATAFVIKGDSIRYVDTEEVPYPYAHRNDSLIVQIEMIPFGAKIVKLDEDSLHMESNGKLTRYARVKK